VDTISPLQNLRATCRTSDVILSPYHRCRNICVRTSMYLFVVTDFATVHKS